MVLDIVNSLCKQKQTCARIKKTGARKKKNRRKRGTSLVAGGFHGGFHGSFHGGFHGGFRGGFGHQQNKCM